MDKKTHEEAELEHTEERAFSSDESEASFDDESEGDGQPFDEASLLELAKNEGLVDVVVEDETPIDTAKPLDLSDEDQANIMASIETILFMSDKPVSLPKLRTTINAEIPLAAYRVLMARLREEFNKTNRGVEIAELALGFQLRTKAHMASVLRKLVKTQPLRLSSATMEVLAIVAYKQPVTKDELDQIRGVDSGYVLRNLMEKRLVKIAGRSDLPGKPMVYGTSHEFLELFNLKDTGALPPLHEVEQMVAASEVGFEEKTQRVMEEFGKMVEGSTKVLFDDSQIDTELEALRAEIASIPTSTSFIDEQKAKEKHEARLAELAPQGLTLDAAGNVVTFAEMEAAAAAAAAAAATELALEVAVSIADELVAAPLDLEAEEHRPSAELEAEAAAAQWERHAAMISEAVAVVNTEALVEAKVEVEIDNDLAEERDPEAEL